MHSLAHSALSLYNFYLLPFSIAAAPSIPQSMDSVLLTCFNKCYIIFTWQPPDNSAATNVSHYLFYLNDNLVSAEIIVLVLDETGTNQMSFTEANCVNQTVGISASNGCFEGPRTSMMVTPRNLTAQDMQRIPNVYDLLMEECGSESPTMNGGTTNTQCKLNGN